MLKLYSRRTIQLILFIVFLSACHSTSIDNLKFGDRPDDDSDYGGIWYQMQKYEKMIKYSPARVRDPALNKYVYDLTCQVAGKYCSDIRVYIVDMPYLNAFMTANGMLVIWSGLLLRAQTKDQLASVIGHEVGHYVKQHSLKRIRKEKNLQHFLVGMGMITYTGALITSIPAQAAVYKHSRNHERESDAYGLKRLKALNLNPKAAAQIWILAQQEAKALPYDRSPIFLSTHPSHRQRIKYLGGSQTMQIEVIKGEHQHFIEKHYDHWLKREISKRHFNASEIVLTRLANVDKNHPIIEFYLGELYRKRNNRDDLIKAKTHYENALKFGFSDAKIHNLLGRVNSKMRFHDEAIVNYINYLKFGNLSLPRQKSINQQILKIKAM